ncbi:universal stress protein [Rubrobacter marinus]|uniref:universal stress protein n=1 Tax=Rubrobacter marinus TaxID=2653852 RepID=UPI0014088258|nr:universal stress protein [Rubrobacter marinus]
MAGLPKKILLAIDGSGDAKLAARIAVDLCAKTGSELHVVHAWRPVIPPVVYPGAVPEVHREPYEAEAREILDAQTSGIEEAGAEIRCKYLREGPPVDTILDLAVDLGAGLILLGRRGMGRMRRLLLGSVSEGVVHHARCPVLVADGEGSWPPSRVVLADDASVDAERACELAAAIGKLFGAAGILVRAYPRRKELVQEGPFLLTRIVDDRLEGRGSLNRRARELARILGSQPEVRSVAGEAAPAIIRAAREDAGPALIAMGSRGLGPIKRLRLGSVSSKVLRVADGSILIYPHLGNDGG